MFTHRRLVENRQNKSEALSPKEKRAGSSKLWYVFVVILMIGTRSKHPKWHMHAKPLPNIMLANEHMHAYIYKYCVRKLLRVNHHWHALCTLYCVLHAVFYQVSDSLAGDHSPVHCMCMWQQWRWSVLGNWQCIYRPVHWLAVPHMCKGVWGHRGFVV